MIRTGYILSLRHDMVWFLGLPFIAVGFALVSQNYLPFVALASINLWITAPHQFVTFLRTYGHREDRVRWKGLLIAAPIFIFLMTMTGFFFAPLTVALLVMLWDHQHSIMQQHGFARIYDFKAGSGDSLTRRQDLALHWVLYGNLLVNAPLFSSIWMRELHRWHVPLSVSAIETVQALSWATLILYSALYLIGVMRAIRGGASINPIKYIFIGASYFLWYFTAWHTHSLLVLGIAHRIMHGVQYIVIVYWFLRRKGDSANSESDFAIRLTRRGNVMKFLLACAAWAGIYQLLIGLPLETTFFGLFDFAGLYEHIPSYGLNAMDQNTAYDIFAVTLIDTLAITHYYFDSFIWKVRDQAVQEGLS